ncbi:hypothetical protein GE09DRAFT_49894 [Coniochaeta sp. 2T2.1]|nr:hypothetical protein GE09DRAFT_49894 [Coniochaeta sp. 2T2.1]
MYECRIPATGVAAVVLPLFFSFKTTAQHPSHILGSTVRSVLPLLSPSLSRFVSIVTPESLAWSRLTVAVRLHQKESDRVCLCFSLIIPRVVSWRPRKDTKWASVCRPINSSNTPRSIFLLCLRPAAQKQLLAGWLAVSHTRTASSRRYKIYVHIYIY